MKDKKNEKAVTYCQALNFNASDKQLSPVLINNTPYFVAVEVCEILELGNVSEAIRRLDDDEKLTSVLMRSGQNREVNLVNESGLYNLIFQSRKPAAKLFRKWVTSEVLPSLRKTGSYTLVGNKHTPVTRRGDGMTADILNLLWLIGEYLLQGDQKDIALQLGVSTISVCNVLNGRQRSNRILTALYNRARSNRDAGLIDFYGRPHQMQERLLGISNGGMNQERRILHTGTPIQVAERGRGALPGNKNAQKGGKL